MKKRKNQIGKKAQLFLLFGLLLFIIVGWLGIKIKKELDSSVITNSSRVTLLLVSDQIILTSFDLINEKAVILPLPGNLYLQVPGGYGHYLLSNIYKLSQQEKRSGLLVKRAVESSLGLPIDGWIKISKLPESKNKNFNKLESYLSDNYSIQKLLDNLDKNNTNLSFFDKLKMKGFLNNLKENNIRKLNFSKIGASQSLTLPDNSKAVSLDQKIFDNNIGELFYHHDLAGENKSIAVINATEITGLGNQVARLIINSGGHVVSIDNAKEENRTQCFSKSVNNPTINFLKKIIQCDVTKTISKKTDYVIILGKDNTVLFL